MEKIKKTAVWAILAVVLLATVVSGGAAPIKIGANFELSGGLAFLSKSCISSIQLYFDQVNANGGVLGQKIELVIANNQGNPKGAADVTQKLIDRDKVVAILGPITSSDCLGAAPVCQAKNIVMLTATATNPAVTEVGDYIFRACFIDATQGSTMARFASDTLNIHSAAIVTDDGNTYSQDLAQAFRERFLKDGGTIAVEAAIKEGTKDYTPIVQSITAQNPGLIFAPLYYREAGLLAKTARDHNLQLPILGGDGWDSADLTKIAGNSPLNNVYFLNHYSIDNPDPQNVAFLADYKKKAWGKPNPLSALAYDTAAMLVQAIREAGNLKSVNIRDAMAKLKFKGVSGNLTFDANRNPVKTAVVIELKDGVQVFHSAIEPETKN